MSKFDLGEYVDVNARLAWFFANYPEGSLSSKVLVGPESGECVVVQAYAFRHPLDPQPGGGLAYEVFPGTTPYTKGSELMNAETSAWGRALAAIGAPTKGHVASADEVKGASTRRQRSAPSPSEPEYEQPPQAEPTSEGGGAVATSEESDGAGTAASGGGPASDQPLPSDHEHEWMQSPTLKTFVVCKDQRCRKVMKKSEAGVA